MKKSKKTKKHTPMTNNPQSPTTKRMLNIAEPTIAPIPGFDSPTIMP